ncbi:MAG TPA: phospholipase D-like domain-containing protein [Chroococcales cyanobacterium]
MSTDPEDGKYEIQEAHLKAIANAKQEIVLIYPYFSDDRMVDEVVRAKKKYPNLSVRVLIPGGKEDSFIGTLFTNLNDSTAIQLLSVGAEVRTYEGDTVNGKKVERFSHFKGLLIDNALLSIGSANADARSFHDNHELNTLISDDEAIRSFRERVVEPDWASAKPLSLDQLQGGWFRKLKRAVLEWLDFLF